jgi:hypothetical protein
LNHPTDPAGRGRELVAALLKAEDRRRRAYRAFNRISSRATATLPRDDVYRLQVAWEKRLGPIGTREDRARERLIRFIVVRSGWDPPADRTGDHHDVPAAFLKIGDTLWCVSWDDLSAGNAVLSRIASAEVVSV